MTRDTPQHHGPPVTWWTRLETYLLVTVITGLIWLYAEGENVKQYEDQPMKVQFVAAPGERLLIEPADPVPISVTFSAATSRYQRVTAMAQQPVRVELSHRPDDPTQVLSTRELLIQNTALPDLGVSIIRVRPESITASVERIVTVELPVTIVTRDVELAEPPAVEPRRIAVDMPQSLSKATEVIDLRVDLADVNLAAIEPGTARTFNLPIRTPPTLREAPGVSLGQSTVRVTLTIRKQADTITVPTVPILMLAPPSSLRNVSIALTDQQKVLRDVQLTGPSDQIERIRTGEYPVWAWYRLTAEDIGQRITSAPLQLRLPQGVAVESDLPPANFTIEPLNGAAP